MIKQNEREAARQPSQFFYLSYLRLNLILCRTQHILNENSVPRGGITYGDVRDGIY